MNKKIIKAYFDIFKNFGYENIENFDQLIDEEIIFIDPFNNIKGKENFKKIFIKTLENVKNPNFKIINYNSKKNLFFVKWEMDFNAYGDKQKIIGMSEIILSKTGKIKFHQDYWDSYSQIYTKLPIIGIIFRFVLKIIQKKI